MHVLYIIFGLKKPAAEGLAPELVHKAVHFGAGMEHADVGTSASARHRTFGRRAAAIGRKVQNVQRSG